MEKKCCICGKTFIDYGNNAEPIRKGICCNSCNVRYVINSRILQWEGTFEIVKTFKELKNIDKKLTDKNFELRANFQKFLKRYENIETGENVIVCIL